MNHDDIKTNLEGTLDYSDIKLKGLKSNYQAENN